MKVRKAIITAAGMGTRFLPITKSQPKEMLPLVDKPVIQYAVEEAIDSGIEQIIIVTSQGKHAIEDYFDRSHELENFLAKKGEKSLLKEIRRVSSLVDICYIRQKEQRGLGHAVLTAKDLVDEEPVAVILPDDVMVTQVPVLKQMLKVFYQYKASVIAVEKIPPDEVSRYGIIKPRQVSDRLYQVLDLIEKPAQNEAPSDLGIIGRYILTPEIFKALTKTKPGRNHEIQLTDGLKVLLESQPIYGYRFEGKRYDTGTPLAWLEANVTLALQHPELGPQLKKRLGEINLRS